MEAKKPIEVKNSKVIIAIEFSCKEMFNLPKDLESIDDNEDKVPLIKLISNK